MVLSVHVCMYTVAYTCVYLACLHIYNNIMLHMFMQSCTTINIKNIKIGPLDTHKAVTRRIYIECEDNLTEDDKEQLMQLQNTLDDLEISLIAETKYFKDEGNV